MIIKNNKTISSIYKGNKAIDKVMKGTLVVYEAFKKLIASGVPPITLQKCKAANLVDYKIYGNSVQNGTPTPDAPIEIESVGDKTKNLLKPTDNVLGSLLVADGSINSSIRYVTTTDYISLKAGTYTISYKAGANLRYVAWFNENKEIVGNVWSGRNNPFKFTIDQDYLVRFDIERDGNVNIDNLATFLTDYEVQVEGSSTPTEYEPYGYKIPVKVRGKNLISYPYSLKSTTTKGITFTVNDDGSITADGTATDNVSFVFKSPSTPIKLTKGKNYIISGCPSGGYTDKLRYYLSIQDTSYKQGHQDFGNGVKMTAQYDNYYMWIYIVKDETIKNITFKPQIEEGGTVTTYEPYHEPITTNIYLNEPLRKVGDYADYIDFEKSKVFRNVKELILTGTESWGTPWGSGYNTFRLSIQDIYDETGYSDKFKGYCNCYRPSTHGVTYGKTDDLIIASQVESLSIMIRDTRFNGTTTFKEMLAEKYASGNPVIVDYLLAEETSEDITLPNIPLNKGTNIIEVDTNILPSNMEVVYYGKGKLQTLNETDNIVLNSILATDTETELDITDTEINQILDEIIGG